MNVTCLVGRLTADPEVKVTQSGVKVCRFDLAISRQYKEKDGTYATDFIPCIAWRETAVFLEKYFKKGQNIGVNGTIQTRNFKDKDTGKNRTAVEIIANNIYFVESKGSSGQTPSFSTPNAKEEFMKGMDNVISDDGDLPF